jgi:trans-aconitate methyltransferase
LTNRFSTVVRAHLPKSLQAMLWNFEYRHGRWSHLDRYDNSELIKLIEQYHSGGTMLDLGCGTAANFTPPPAFSYLGVDISREAIRTADRRRRPNASYRIASVSDYLPTGMYDVILMREVLHYLPLPVVRKVLDRMTDALTPDGIAVIQIRSTDIHRPVLDAVLQSRLVVAERHDRVDGSCTLIMFRAAAFSGGVTVQPG